MRKPMPKLRLIKGVQKKLLARDKSIGLIFESKTPKFYQVGGEILASAALPPKLPGTRSIVVARLNRQTGFFEIFSGAALTRMAKSIAISATGTVGARDGLTVGKTGLNIFRLFLNEAIAFAKATSLKTITLSAENEKLKEYCARLGFKFEDREKPLDGIFLLK